MNVLHRLPHSQRQRQPLSFQGEVSSRWQISQGIHSLEELPQDVCPEYQAQYLSGHRQQGRQHHFAFADF